MVTPACAVGRLTATGPWVGFAPSFGDGYDIVVGTDKDTRRGPGDADDLLSLVVVYFEDSFDEAPEELGATLADIGSLVRHLAGGTDDPDQGRRLVEAVDAIDDGLATDVVVSRLSACLSGAEEPVARLTRRATELLGIEGR